MSQLTPSQTIGPFFAEGLRWAVDATVRAASANDVTVDGRVLDAIGAPVADALLEIRQPSASAGTLAGFQRIATDPEGVFRFHVARDIRHADVTVFARGLSKAANTRVHLNADHVPAAVPAGRAYTLVAQPTADAAKFTWDIRLSGGDETVFFEFQGVAHR